MKITAAPKNKTKVCKVDISVAPQNGKPNREVVARWGDHEFIDKIDPFKWSDRKKFAERLAEECGIEDPQKLKNVKALIIAKAQEADAQAEQAANEQAKQAKEATTADIPYKATPGGLVYFKPSRDGEVVVPLTNFVATIITDIAEDDGVEARHTFEIQARLGEREARFTVPAQQFATMNWAIEHLGGQAVVYPGMGTRDQARAAVQLTSGEISEEKVYTCTGWRMHDKQPVYLHADGAIGQDGVVDGVRVRLPDPLAGYGLPKPNMGTQLIQAIEAVLRLLSVAPLKITIPLFAAIWRVVLGNVDFSLFLTGRSGAGKTELAALVQQFFGPTMDARHLPTSWATTANAVEALAFHAANAILVVDDFAPGGRQFDVARTHKEADRLLRAQGNSSGRGRMRPDASLRPAKWPRGMILSTGEDTPRGYSLRARMLVLEVPPEAVDWECVTKCQTDAAQGIYALALSGFICWLAGEYSAVQKKMKSRVKTLRDKASASDRHKRTPVIVGDLYFGLEQFTEFAVAVAALSKKQATALLEKWWTALGEAAASHSDVQAGSDPVRRFLELLNAAVAAGRAHIAGADGRQPHRPQMWGWREHDKGWEPRGDRIGWVDGDTLYLEPEMAFMVAQRMGQEGGEALTVGSKTLHKRLHEGKLLVKVDAKRSRLTPRKTLEGKLREVLCLRAKVFGAIPMAVPES